MRKTNQLVHFELHVDDRTFYLHGIVKARNKAEADMMLQGIHGKNYSLQVKGLLGKATLKNMTWALKDSVPNDAYRCLSCLLPECCHAFCEKDNCKKIEENQKRISGFPKRGSSANNRDDVLLAE